MNCVAMPAPGVALSGWDEIVLLLFNQKANSRDVKP